MIEINNEQYCQHYKEIYSNAILNGYIIPDILPPVPNEYKFTDDELKKIHNKITNKEKDKIKEAYKERRKQELELYDKPKKFQEYRENELTEFLKVFPEYKEIIIL